MSVSIQSVFIKYQIPDNVTKLAKAGAITAIVDTMKVNHENDEVLQMAAAVLSNIASDKMVSGWMIEGGVLEVMMTVSTAFPDLIDLQKSCLGCLGNLCQNAENVYTMLDQGCGKRILEILERLYFDDSIVTLSLSLIKILTHSPEVATQMVRDGAAEIITQILKENVKKESVIRICSQTLCKCIVNTESSEIAGTAGVIDALCDVAKEPYTCYNAPLMIDVMKVCILSI